MAAISMTATKPIAIHIDANATFNVPPTPMIERVVVDEKFDAAAVRLKREGFGHDIAAANQRLP